ncbi:MAG: hypothetical protein K0R08_1257 [Solimicrobium sp.]|jgi:hypothetical protein|nr:hypothetical protein [Solimicrobium sp.]
MKNSAKQKTVFINLALTYRKNIRIINNARPILGSDALFIIQDSSVEQARHRLAIGSPQACHRLATGSLRLKCAFLFPKERTDEITFIL